MHVLGANALVVILVLAAVACIATAVVARKRYVGKQRKLMQAWIASVSAVWSDNHALTEIVPPEDRWQYDPYWTNEFYQVRTHWSGAADRIERAKRRAQEFEKAAARTVEAEAALVEIMQLDEDRRREALESFRLYAELTEESRLRLKEERGRLFREYAAKLLEAARKGERQAFLTLSALVQGYHYQSMTEGKYDFPVDWDGLVIRYFKAPAVADFHNQLNEAKPADVETMAGEALRGGGDLLLAKYVLALTRPGEKGSELLREAVGTIRADLIKLVARLHETKQEELRLIFA
jgi:hypothetical protein